MLPETGYLFLFIVVEKQLQAGGKGRGKEGFIQGYELFWVIFGTYHFSTHFKNKQTNNKTWFLCAFCAVYWGRLVSLYVASHAEMFPILR